MEIIYAVFYTIGISLIFSQYEDVICEYILRLMGQKEIEAEIVGFGNNGVYPYNRGGFDYRTRSLVQVKYEDEAQVHTRFIYRDRDDWLHDKIKVLIHPKTGCVVRCGGRRTYFNCSMFTKYSVRIMAGIGWIIEFGILAFTLWIIKQYGSLLFVVIYSFVAAAICLFINYHLMMGEQERIDKHSFTL